MSEKIEQFWRDADGADVMRVMGGEVIEARFRDFDSEEWGTKFLLGYLGCGPLGCNWIDMGGTGWKQCQVYDPPAWFVNKPDPGEGWRLLEKFPPEGKLGTDEAWAFFGSCWQVTKNDNGVQEETTWYRRRIANNPEIPDSSTAANSSETPNSSRSRDTIPSGWRLLGKDEERLASDAYWSLGCKEWIVLGDDRVGVANREKLHAIRQIVVADFFLLEGYDYSMPGGQTIRITAKGFEVV